MVNFKYLTFFYNLFLGIIIGVLGFLGMLVVAFVLFKKKRKNNESEVELEKQKINDFAENKSQVTIIKYETLTMKEILGEGTFGVVQR